MNFDQLTAICNHGKGQNSSLIYADKTPSSFVIIAMTSLFTPATPIMQRLCLLSHIRPRDNEYTRGHSWDI